MTPPEQVLRMLANIRKPCRIIPMSETKGTIDGVMVREETVRYEVDYYYNGSRYSLLCREDEIEVQA